MNPTLKAFFPDFKDISVDEINQRNSHPRRLMAAIENSVNSLNDVETFTEYVTELGRRHSRYSLKPTKADVSIFMTKDYLCKDSVVIKAHRRGEC